MKDTIKQSLRIIKDHFGTDIFNDKKKFKAALMDVKIERTDAIAIRNALEIAFCKMRIYSRLNARPPKDNPFIVDNLIDEMSREYFMDKNIAKIIIESIADELFGYITPTSSSPSPPSPTHLPPSKPPQIQQKKARKWLKLVLLAVGAVIIVICGVFVVMNLPITVKLSFDDDSLVDRILSEFNDDTATTEPTTELPTEPITEPLPEKILTKSVADALEGPEVVVPYGYTEIGEGAFEARKDMTSITLPGSVTHIRRNAFRYCHNLMSVNISVGATYIGDSAFRVCSKLTSITIPDGVTYIGTSAFYECRRLTSITIPDSVTYIGFTVAHLGAGPNLTIYCSKNSTAHQYCKDNSIKFEVSDE